MEEGEDKKIIATTHKWKDPNNHYNHCNIYGHTKEECWKLHLELNLKNLTRDVKKKNLMAKYSSNQMENNSDMDENIFYTLRQKEVILGILH